jgi:predicted AAA+ superfamily ATPase
MVKTPKIYFIDAGVVNYFLKNFNRLELRNDAGFLFENIIFSEILKNGVESSELKFWGDKNQREVDLVVDIPSCLTALEIKYKRKIKGTEFSGLRAFENMYRHRQPLLLLVNIGEQFQSGNIGLRLPFHIGDSFLRPQ